MQLIKSSTLAMVPQPWGQLFTAINKVQHKMFGQQADVLTESFINRTWKEKKRK